MINQRNMAKSRGAVYMKPKRIIGIAAKILNGASVTQIKSTTAFIRRMKQFIRGGFYENDKAMDYS